MSSLQLVSFTSYIFSQFIFIFQNNTPYVVALSLGGRGITKWKVDGGSGDYIRARI